MQLHVIRTKLFPLPFLCTIFSSFVVGILGYQVPKLLIEITRLPRWTFKLQTIYFGCIPFALLYYIGVFTPLTCFVFVI